MNIPRRRVELSSLFFSELCVCNVSKYPEMSEIWFLTYPHLFQGYDPFIVVTSRSVM